MPWQRRHSCPSTRSHVARLAQLERSSTWAVRSQREHGLQTPRFDERVLRDHDRGHPAAEEMEPAVLQRPAIQVAPRTASAEPLALEADEARVDRVELLALEVLVGRPAPGRRPAQRAWHHADQENQDHGRQPHRERVRRGHQREPDEHEHGHPPRPRRRRHRQRALATDVFERSDAAHANVEGGDRAHPGEHNAAGADPR